MAAAFSGRNNNTQLNHKMVGLKTFFIMLFKKKPLILLILRNMKDVNIVGFFSPDSVTYRTGAPHR